MRADASPEVTTTSPHPSVGTSSDPANETLQLIADGITEVAGWGVAAISAARDDGQMQVMAVAGDQAAKAALEGTRTPIASLMAELAKADDWGLLKFVPHERIDFGDGDWGWVPDMVPLDAEDAWHPLDLLVAPLLDSAGVLRGTLSIDLPRDGRRPGPEQRAVLNTYAEQAGRAIVTALEREKLAQQVRLAAAARTIIRNVSGQLSVDGILEECSGALTAGFQASGMWMQTFDDGRVGTGRVHTGDGRVITLPDEVVSFALLAALRGWEAKEGAILSRERSLNSKLDPAQREQVLTYLESISVASLLFVPIGAGPECLGALVLTRSASETPWTEVEAAAALDVGYDLGRAILNARTFEREHRLVQELRALDTYKSQLIRTVSHELKNPLAAILGHLEMLEGSDLDRHARSSLHAIDRGAHRLERVVDDLLLMSKVGDPSTPLLAVPVDLGRVVREVVDLTGVTAERRRLRVHVDVPRDPVVALGEAVELDRVVSNLLSNAVKYTPEGRSITVSLHRRGEEIELAVADEGIGISAEDQGHLFTEFFRSTNPLAMSQPGTGLGLAIVSRILTRHGGRIEVDSTLGAGSTFRVFLPAA